jgi:hypothetical protein
MADSLFAADQVDFETPDKNSDRTQLNPEILK